MTTRIESRVFDRAAYVALLKEAGRQADPAEAWLYLEAAHIVGQLEFGPHLETHARMLSLACRTRDWGEAGGQLFRLLLVPLGHLTGRLPLGNPGRATVGAFTPMPIRPELAALMRDAQRNSSPGP